FERVFSGEERNGPEDSKNPSTMYKKPSNLLRKWSEYFSQNGIRRDTPGWYWGFCRKHYDCRGRGLTSTARQLVKEAHAQAFCSDSCPCLHLFRKMTLVNTELRTLSIPFQPKRMDRMNNHVSPSAQQTSLAELPHQDGRLDKLDINYFHGSQPNQGMAGSGRPEVRPSGI
ncbi:hypothetical protein EDD17DRAFT_1618656, partial [Pisolithus thermaeus]